MTIKELKEAIKDLPDEMEIGGEGHFGEMLEVYGVRVRKQERRVFQPDKEWFLIEMESPGQEPD